MYALNVKRGFALAAAAVLASACGGKKSSGDSLEVRSETIGHGGGSIELPSGASIVVPPDALADDVRITVRETPTTPDGALSPIYAFEPPGTTFASPVTISLPIPRDATAATVYWTRSGGVSGYDALPTTVASGTASAEVTELEPGFAGQPCAQAEACTPADPCHAGSRDCSTGAPRCLDTLHAGVDGLSCSATGGQCSAGACREPGGPPLVLPVGPDGGSVFLPVGPAFPAGVSVVIPPGALPAETPITVQVLDVPPPPGAVSPVVEFGPAGTTFDPPAEVYLPVPAGTTAGSVYWSQPGSTTAFDVLDATFQGTFVRFLVSHFSIGYVGATCVPDAACTSADPCRTGREVCSAGFPTCGPAGNVADGTACGADRVCSAGACVACVANAPCSGNPDPLCNAGVTSCSTGTSVCVDGPSRPNGTTCGTDRVCSTGECVACAAGGACGTNPTACLEGVLSCATGAQACVDSSAPRADGTGCGVERVCSAGACVACTPGAVCSTNPDRACHLGVTACSAGPACVDGTARSDGTSCGADRVCSAGACVGCVAGSACAGNPNPCVEGEVACASGPACADTSVAVADATACGAGQACWAAACVPVRTVTASTQRTFWPDAGPVAPVPSAGAGDTATAAFSTAGGERQVVAPFAADGVAVLPAVPSGPYRLTWRSASDGTLTAVETSADAVDLGFDWLGRPDQALATAPTPTTLRITGLVPWHRGSDVFEIFSSNAGTGVYAFGEWSIDELGSGLSSATGVLDWNNGYSTLVDAALGDFTYFHQLASRHMWAGGERITYQQNVAAYGTPSFTVRDGIAGSADVPLAPLPQTGAIRIDWRRSQFHGAFEGSTPGLFLSEETVYVDAQAHGDASPFPVYAQGGTPDLFVVSPPPSATDLDLGTLTYGQHLPPLWREWRSVGIVGTVPVRAPGATSTSYHRLRMSQSEPMPAPEPIVPLLGPPRAPLIDGTDAFRPPATVSATPLLSWSAPAVGTPARYAVSLFAVSADAAGGTVQTYVGTLYTEGTSFQVPPGLLAEGGAYVVEIAAELGTRVEEPFRARWPRASASILTGVLVVCSGPACAPCVPGAACLPPENSCHTGVVACAGNVPVCQDTSVARPDGTRCGRFMDGCWAGTCYPGRYVNGIQRLTFWTDDGRRTEVPDPALATTGIAALFGPPDAPFRAPAAIDAATGDFSISRVGRIPDFYWLERTRPGEPTAYFEMRSVAPDLGEDHLGRSDQALRTGPTPVTFELSGLTPWDPAADNLEAFSSNAGSVAYLFGDGNPQLTAGATTASGTRSWPAYASLPDASQGDGTYFHQLTTRAVNVGGSLYTYGAVANALGPVAVTIVDLQAQTVAVPLTPVAETGAVSVDWRGSEWAALVPFVHPQATFRRAGVVVDAAAHGVALPMPHHTNGGWPDLFLWSAPPAAAVSDVDLGTLLYGQYLPPMWQEFRWAFYDVVVPFAAPGATPRNFGVRLERLAPMPDATPVAPAIGPPTSPRVNGLDAFGELPPVGTTPTIAWSAPALGTSTSHRVTLYRIDADGSGGTALTPVASFTTRIGSVHVPPGLLEPGNTYFAAIAAVSKAVETAGYGPFRGGFPTATASCVTAPFSP